MSLEILPIRVAGLIHAIDYQKRLINDLINYKDNDDDIGGILRDLDREIQRELLQRQFIDVILKTNYIPLKYIEDIKKYEKVCGIRKLL